MRFSTVFATSALVSAVAASTLTARQASYPDCALPCVLNAPTGDCGQNVGCLCKDQNFISSTTICIQKACTGKDLEDAESISRQQCAAVGVTLTQTSFAESSTDASAPSSSSEAASSSGASSSTSAGTTTSTSSAGTSGTSSGTSAQTSQTSPSSAGTAPASTSTGAASSSRTISTFALVGAVALGALAL